MRADADVGEGVVGDSGGGGVAEGVAVGVRVSLPHTPFNLRGMGGPATRSGMRTVMRTVKTTKGASAKHAEQRRQAMLPTTSMTAAPIFSVCCYQLAGECNGAGRRELQRSLEATAAPP